MQETADQAAMRAIQNGDTAQLGALFERHHQAIYRFCYRMTGNTQSSEDLVQEVFVRVLRFCDRFDLGSEFRSWLFALARNACMDLFRRNRVRAVEIGVEPTDQDRAISPTADPEGDVAGELMSERLHQALLRLPDDQRELIVLTRLEFRKQSEVAALLGCTEAAVKARIYRAARQLRKEFRHLEQEVAR